MSKFGLLIVTITNDDRGDKIRSNVKKQFVEATSLDHAHSLRNALEFSVGAPLVRDEYANEEYHVAYKHYLRHGGSVLFTLPELKALCSDCEEAFTAPSAKVLKAV